MTTTRIQRLARNRVTIDSHAMVLAGVLVGVAVISVLITQELSSTAGAPSGVPASVKDPETGKANATGGGVWVVVEIVAASLLLASLVVYTKAPAWIQAAVRRATGFFVFALVGAMLAVTGLFWTVVPGLMLGYIAAQGLDRVGVYWALNNLLSVGLAVVTAVIIARLAGPLAIGVALVGLTVYDHVFANKREWMFQLAMPAVKWKLPVVFVLPNRWRFEWRMLHTEPDDSGEEGVHGLGTADIALPAGFVASIATSGMSAAYVVAGVVLLGVGVAAFRLRYLMTEYTDRGGAGLPSITTGALAGFVVAYGWVLVVGLV